MPRRRHAMGREPAMTHTAADGMSEAFGGLARVLLVVFVVLLILDVRPWVWLALSATALVFAIEVALVTRQRSFGGALGTAVRRHLRAGLGALDRPSRGGGGGGWEGGGDGGGDGGG